MLTLPDAIDFLKPSAARIHDLFASGFENYPPDRELAARLLGAAPWLRSMVAINGAQRPQAVCTIARELGIRQFPYPAQDGTGGALFLAGAGAGSSASPIEDGEITSNPPVHLACALESARRCPHLLKGYVAAYVDDPLPWGVLGIRFDLTATGFPLPRAKAEQVRYGSDEQRLVLARHALVELNGCRPVNLLEEARRAGL